MAQQLVREKEVTDALDYSTLDENLEMYRKLWFDYRQGREVDDEEKLSRLLGLLEEGSRESSLGRIALESYRSTYI